MQYRSLVVLLFTFAAAALAQSGSIVRTGDMTTQRALHTATALPDGRVLLTGGTNGRGTMLASAEIYDPATGTFRATGSMSRARQAHSAVLLQDGRVLIVGRDGPGFEIYDPATGSFSPAPAVGYQAWGRSAAAMPDGKVLIIGDNADLYDPRRGTADWLGTLVAGQAPAWQITAAALPDGRIFVNAVDSIALYDPRGGMARLVEKHDLQSSYEATVTTLTNGQVFIAGGYSYAGWLAPTQAQDLLYDPRSGARPLLSSLHTSRGSHAATLLKDGRVLLSGGFIETTATVGLLSEAEVYDPATGISTSAATDIEGRMYHTATLLQDGRVLLAGGSHSLVAVLYIPETRAVSAANLTGTLAPGALASLFGTQLAATTATADPLSAPTSLGGISIRVRDQSGAQRLARLLYVSPAQINFQVPPETSPGGGVTITVLRSSGREVTTGGWVGPVAPGLFAGPTNTAAATLTADVATLWGTGLRNRSSLANVTVDAAGLTLPVEYAGPEGSGIPGLDQVNVRLPASLLGRGAFEISVTVDGVRSNVAWFEIP
jgi:uncharacterized protein (TIGR03437 family)